ncbi:MAG: hypothetical protein Q4C70_12150, partial [Planctomycetia bacterium]|nr:hypothetical protein [Planctomycetia bacterium]
MKKTYFILICASMLCASVLLATQIATGMEILFQTDFPGASIGDVEKVEGKENTWRVNLLPQHDEKNLNRQATWFAFRVVVEMNRGAGESVKSGE